MNGKFTAELNAQTPYSHQIHGGMSAAPRPPERPSTIAATIESLSALVNDAAQLSGRVERLANRLGGPVPCAEPKMTSEPSYDVSQQLLTIELAMATHLANAREAISRAEQHVGECRTTDVAGGGERLNTRG